MDGLMEIGKFAAASGLSIDALRHYDEVGLLKPASVDARTSYRRYSVDQLSDAQLICSLRGVDLPLEDLRTLLNEREDTDQVQQVLQRHRARLAQRADALEKMIATSNAFTQFGVPVPAPSGARVVQVALASRDHYESVRFYTEVFGFSFNSDISSFVFGAWQTESFFLLTIEDWFDGGSPSAFGLLVDDVDERHARALTHGATEVTPPADYGWKPRASVFDDPAGNRIQISQG